MIRALALSTIAALALSACAKSATTNVEATPAPQAQPAQAAARPATPATPTGAFDPVGAWTFAVNTQGNTIGGTMNVRKNQDGSLGGEMASDQGTLTFTSVSLDGRRMTAAGVLDNGPELVFVFDFAGDEFTGSLSAQGQSVGSISGARKKD